MCYFEETKRTQHRVLTLAEKRQFTVDAIKQKSLILSQLYAMLKQCLTSDSESTCQNSYAKKLSDILRGEELGILPSSSIDKRLDSLKKVMFPAEQERRSSSRESRQETERSDDSRGSRETERPDKMQLRCVAKCEKGRKARLTWEEGQLHIYGLCKDPEEAHITLNVCCIDVGFDFINLFCMLRYIMYIKLYCLLRYIFIYIYLCCLLRYIFIYINLCFMHQIFFIIDKHITLYFVISVFIFV